MPRTVADAASDTASRSQVPGLRLPVDEYALLVPLEISRSAVVVHDSGNLSNSHRIPLEVFPRKSLLARDIAVEATQGELSRTGLADVFEARPDTLVHSMRLDQSGTAAGVLLFRTAPGQGPEGVISVCERNMDDLNRILAQTRPVTVSYQWEILKNTFKSPVPCVVINQERRMVFANAMFSELVGIGYDELIGSNFEDSVHLEKDFGPDVPEYPESVEASTPLFLKTQSLFFISNVTLSTLRTACGSRLVYSFCDLLTDQRMGNSNIQLIQKLSAMIMSEDPPPVMLRKLVNIIALTLGCDLVCIMKRKRNEEIIATPYSNRRLETLRANCIEPAYEPVLKPYFSHGIPVLCENVEKSCNEQSFFRRVLPISRFAFVPAGYGAGAEHALLMAWSRRSISIGSEALPVLRVIANLVGTVLARGKLAFQIEQEKETLRRYTRLTTGRELRMAALKRQNASLRDLIAKLGSSGKERCTE